MRASQGVVVVEHGALELNPLPEEAQVLDLLGLLLVALVLSRKRWNVIHIPEIAGLLDSLVAINLSLLVGPVRERLSVGPHGNLCWHVN